MHGRWIRPNKSDAQPSAIVCVDTESLPERVGQLSDVVDHVFRLGCASYLRLDGDRPTRRKAIQFSTSQAFWSWLDKVSDRKRPTWLWCHNAAADLVWLDLADRLTGDPPEYSMHPEVWGAQPGKPLPPSGWRGFACLSDPPTMLRLRNLNGWTLNILDLMNWIPRSLEDVGQWVGLDKVPLPDFAHDDDRWFARCRRDVEILEAAVLKLLGFVRDNDLGLFRWTAASQSLAYWRHKHQTHRIAPHQEADVQTLERDGYFGGLTDLRYRGEVKPRSQVRSKQQLLDLDSPDEVCYGPIHELDCNSLYPALYQTTDVPCVLLDWSIPAAGIPARPIRLAADCLATVLVQPTIDPYPVRLEEGVVYPMGSYWTTLCGPELQRAVDRDEILECSRWSRYECKPALRSYGIATISGRAEARRAGQPIEEQLWKFLANALHGKFGQRPNEWSMVADKVAEEPWQQWRDRSVTTGKQTLYRSVGYDVQVQGRGAPPSHTFTAVAAWITSAAREHVRRLAEIAGRWQCLYSCTDAIYVTDVGLARLQAAGCLREGVPGMLRLTHTGRSADFRGIGWLRLGRLYKRSGVPANARPVGNGWLTFSQWAGLEKTLWGDRPNAVRVRDLVRCPPAEWWRGRIMSQGWIERLRLQGSEAGPTLAQPQPLHSVLATTPARPHS